MKKKTTKFLINKELGKKNKQIVEIHIYVHHTHSGTAGTFHIPYGTGTPPNPITNPPYYVTC